MMMVLVELCLIYCHCDIVNGALIVLCLLRVVPASFIFNYQLTSKDNDNGKVFVNILILVL